MTDPITRARKEWCYPEAGITEYLPGPQPMKPSRCPPEVVYELLNVLRYLNDAGRCMVCGGAFNSLHRSRCPAALAKAAITRALEGK